MQNKEVRIAQCVPGAAFVSRLSSGHPRVRFSPVKDSLIMGEALTSYRGNNG